LGPIIFGEGEPEIVEFADGAIAVIGEEITEDAGETPSGVRHGRAGEAWSERREVSPVDGILFYFLVVEIEISGLRNLLSNLAMGCVLPIATVRCYHDQRRNCATRF
jgi:hypothetical protein